ncbi:hypothetical protein [Bacillus cereus]|uniref:hypothetical protein n=1 Tax=Bacillus cereus TaxID=1396 RepID=UPI000BF2CA9F|nr:hypothetical protein [Bacillus cereus]PFV45285.1 hypothetical protein COL00_21550 [Bacillus cereus]PGQ00126.1 hypothetical protein COA09_31030 [Bacillus cereus]PGS55986.1 hypothetical protein COC67_21000 [Bacillus cereus]PGU90849.1 hypothetical protein COD77_30070 [Bacillus cereus]
MKKYIPNMGKANVIEGETLLFSFRTVSNETSPVIGEVVAFDKTDDGIEYIEVNVGGKRTKRYVI